MTVKPPESAIEGQFIRWCEKNKIAQRKMGLNGWPDRMVMLPGNLVVWIEFKRDDGELRPEQREVKRILERAGHTVHVCRTLESAIEACKPSSVKRR